jgi:hypothetical protein
MMSAILLSIVALAEPFELKSMHTSFADGTDDATLAIVKAYPSLVLDKDDDDCTALHYAARYGRLKTA